MTDQYLRDNAPRDILLSLQELSQKNIPHAATFKLAAARITELEAALKDATVRLVAAISLLERGGKKAAPSNKMFEQMLVDYKNGVERARAALGEKDE